jgi:hypothetical protein
MKRLIAFLFLILTASAARAQCVQLTPGHGIGTLQPSSAQGHDRPTISRWSAPTNPTQNDPLGAAGALGHDTDAIFVWSTFPYQRFPSEVGGKLWWDEATGNIRLAVDGDAIGGVTAAGIKFAVDGGTYISATQYPLNRNQSPIHAHGEACAFVNINDLPPGMHEARAEICPLVGYCRELSSVQKASVAADSDVVTVPAHGQETRKIVALTNNPNARDTAFGNFHQEYVSPENQQDNLYCLSGPLTSNTFRLLRPLNPVRTNVNDFGISVPNCVRTFSGWVAGNHLFVDSTPSGSGSLIGLNILSGAGSCYGVVAPCPTIIDGPTNGGTGTYTLSETLLPKWTGENPAYSGKFTFRLNEPHAPTNSTMWWAYFGIQWAGTGTINGTTLTIQNTLFTKRGPQAWRPPRALSNITLALKSGATATIPVNGCTQVGDTAVSAGTHCNLTNLSTNPPFPANITTAELMYAGGPLGTGFSLGVGTIVKAGAAGAQFDVNWYGAGPAEQSPQGPKNNGSLFFFTTPDNAINKYKVWANSIAGSPTNDGTRAHPVQSMAQALNKLAYTTSEGAQTLGGATVDGVTCTTFSNASNVTGTIPYRVGDPVHFTGAIGEKLSPVGSYYVKSVGAPWGANAVTISEQPGGPCLNDSERTSGNQAYLPFDFSTTTALLQCAPTPPSGACPQPARYSYGEMDGIGDQKRRSRFSYLTIAADDGVPEWYTVIDRLPTINLTNLNADNVHISDVKIEFPVHEARSLEAIPASAFGTYAAGNSYSVSRASWSSANSQYTFNLNAAPSAAVKAFTISGVTINSSAISSATWLGGAFTFNTAAATGMAAGRTFVVAGVACDPTSPCLYNSTFTVTSVSGTQVVGVRADGNVTDAGVRASGGTLTTGNGAYNRLLRVVSRGVNQVVATAWDGATTDPGIYASGGTLTPNVDIKVKTADLQPFSRPLRSGDYILGYNGCIGTYAYEGQVVISGNPITNSDGTTDITLGFGNYKNPGRPFRNCPVGTPFALGYYFQFRQALSNLWLDHVNYTAGDVRFSMAGGGLLRLKNTYVSDSASAFNYNGFGDTAMNVNTYSVGLTSKCNQNTPIMINVQCDAFSDENITFFRYGDGIGEGTQNIDTIPPHGVGNKVYVPPNFISVNTNISFHATEICSSGGGGGLSLVTAVDVVAGTISVQTPCAVPANTSAIHMESGAHEDCAFTFTTENYLNTFIMDGYRTTAQCFGYFTGLRELNPVAVIDTLIMDTSMTGARDYYPYERTTYGAIRHGYPTYNMFIKNDVLAYVDMPNRADLYNQTYMWPESTVLVKDTQCSNGGGSFVATEPSMPNLRVINSPTC